MKKRSEEREGPADHRGQSGTDSAAPLVQRHSCLSSTDGASLCHFPRLHIRCRGPVPTPTSFHASRAAMGISRDSLHKRRATGGRRQIHRKKRKYELGRPAANTRVRASAASLPTFLSSCDEPSCVSAECFCDDHDYFRSPEDFLVEP